MTVKIEELLDSSDVTKRNIDFQKNEIIFSQGDPAKAVFYLRKGLVRLSVTSHTGKEALWKCCVRVISSEHGVLRIILFEWQRLLQWSEPQCA